MVAMFSTPILSVAADAVRDLEGRDALSGLWTWSTFRSFVWQAYATFCLSQVFTKCKGSLQNGRRLEIITWRLWHRELRAVEGEGSLSLPADSPLSEKDIGDEKAEFRLSALSEVVYSFHVHPPPEMAIKGVSGSNRQQWLSLPLSAGGLSSRRERFYSLEAPVLLPPSTVGVLDHEEDPVLIGEEMVQPIIVHLPSNALNANGSVSRDVFSFGQSSLPLSMSRQATNYGQEWGALARDSIDRTSISSLSSDLSHVTTGTCVTNSSRTTGGTTLLASLSSVGGGEEKIGKLTDIGLDPIQRLGNVEPTTQKWLCSLSTIHCSAKLADRGRKEKITLEAYNTVGGSNSEKADVDGGVIEVERHSAFTSELKPSVSARRVVKRNSSPVPLTSSPAVLPLTPMSPSSSALFLSDPPAYAAHEAAPFSPERSTSSGSKPATVTDTTNGNVSHTTSSDRDSNRSHSTGGSSSKESRSRSREHLAAPIAGLSGLGTLGGLGMTIAAAYPPPVVVKKQMAVGAGKARVKVALGCAVGGKARTIMRRNSARPGVEIGGKAYGEAKLSETVKVKMEGVIQNDGKETSQHKGSGPQSKSGNSEWTRRTIISASG